MDAMVVQASPLSRVGWGWGGGDGGEKPERPSALQPKKKG